VPDGLFKMLKEHVQRQAKEQPPTPAPIPSPTPTPAATPPAPKLSEPPAKVCPCQGKKTGECFCLKNGQTCHCDGAHGSLWDTDDFGRPVKKVASGIPLSAKIARAPTTVAVAPPPPVVAPASPSAPRTVTIRETTAYSVQDRNGRHEWVDSTGKGWFTSAALVEGQKYGGRFTYRGGKMYEPEKVQSDAPAPPPPDVPPVPKETNTTGPIGHWVTVKICNGNGTCHLEKRWVGNAKRND
jgi:hypothetical protein